MNILISKTLKKYLVLPVLGCFMLLHACKKNNSGYPEPPVSPPVVSAADFAKNFGNPAKRDFVVQIVDERNNSLSGAAVSIGNTSVQTDANGIAILKQANVYEQFAYITVKKAGYMDGSRSLVPAPVGSSTVKVMLFTDKVTATINSGQTAAVSLPNGVKVIFDGSFKTTTGTAYVGSVDVVVNGLEASDPDLFRKMPGMLFARNVAGDAKLLETYGMMNVSLRGSGGQRLQIANKAQIEMNITSAQLASAPATMPLWHFDESLGYWIEEGLANKVGNKYIGEVSHFSWWNFDLPIAGPIVQLQIKLVNGSGNPLAHVHTTLVRPGGSTSFASETEINGTINGPVPANEVLTLKVYDGCSNLVHTQSIGPFSTSTVLPDITLNLTATQHTVLSGSLKKCDNSNVTNGYVGVNYGGQTFVAMVTNGAFNFGMLICSSNSVTLIAEDLDSHQNSGTLNYQLSSPATNVGNLLTCNSSVESITYSIDGGAVKSVTTNINASAVSGHLNIAGGSPVLMNDISISSNTTTPGIYTSATIFQMNGNGLATGLNSTLTSFNMTYNLSSVGSVGQYIDLVFNGTYNEMVMTGIGQGYTLSHSISGTVHVIRDN